MKIQLGRYTRIASLHYLLLAALAIMPVSAHAALSFTVETNGWPNAAHRQAAVGAMQSAINRYNAYNFGNYNMYVYYNAGIPTAQANYLGSIGFGGTYPNERVMMHEIAHYLGSGTYGDPWNGARGEAIVDQFDGLEATLNGDSAHFWPYGLNFDSEGSEINKQRHVALLYAQRADMGIGPSMHPSAATTVTLTASNPVNESGFNFKGQWSDGYFAHAGADYFTGNFTMRTPASGNSFAFAGDSLTVNNSSSDNGLFYKGTGSAGVVTIDDLRLDGGWVQHVNGGNDVFQLDGRMHVLSDSHLRAKQGNMNILADIEGDSALTIHPSDGRFFVRFLSDENTFTGDLVNLARFELAAGANFTFALGANGVNNTISGASAVATNLDGVFDFDLSLVDYSFGNSWQLVTAGGVTYGPTFGLTGFTNNAGLWRDGSFTFDQTSGVLTVAPGSDLNADDIVDLDDWLIFHTNHLADLSPYSPEQRTALGDLNGDGFNDHADFRAFKFQYEALKGTGAFAAMLANVAVPEPSGFALSAMTLLLALKPRDCNPWGTRKM
jgi:hypothetical protein